MDKTTLLNTIQTERLHFESLIAPLSETQLTTATLEGQWSIKDLLIHIAVWEQLCTRWLEEFLRGETPHPEDILTGPVNDRIYRENRNRSLQEAQEVFRQAHQQFLQQVTVLTQALTTEDLNTPHRFAWAEMWPGHSLLGVIANNSYEHYQEHAQQIRRWLDA